MLWRHCLVVAAVRLVVLILCFALFRGLFDSERARSETRR